MRWLGFMASGDTWEPVAMLHEDQPLLVERYLHGCCVAGFVGKRVCSRMPSQLGDVVLALRQQRRRSRVVRHTNGGPGDVESNFFGVFFFFF